MKIVAFFYTLTNSISQQGVGCTTSSGKNGLVANGHGMMLFDYIYSGETLIGYVSNVQFGSGNGDYCIITLYDNFTADGATHYIDNVIRYNNRVHDPMTGDKLFKSTRDHGYAEFTVTDINVTHTYTIDGKDVTISGLTKATITRGDAGKGDSGAGVYHNANDNPNSFLEFSGIVSGGGYEGNEFVVYFTPPKHIHNCTIVGV